MPTDLQTCPQCGCKSKVLLDHVIRYHFRRGGKIICWCGGWASTTLAIRRHIEEEGGPLQHFLECALGIDKVKWPETTPPVRI